jgi:hypothetical protein
MEFPQVGPFRVFKMNDAYFCNAVSFLITLKYTEVERCDFASIFFANYLKFCIG